VITWEGGRSCLEPGDRLVRAEFNLSPGEVRSRARRVQPVSFLVERTGFFITHRYRAALRGTGRYLIVAALLAALLQFGCEAPPDGDQPTTTISVTDHAQRTVTLAAPARRVISLMPAVTDMILALGAHDRLIARTQFDGDPRIAALPSTGNALNPSLEWIAALEPDLVIAWPDQPSRAVVSRLSTMGIPVYAARTESIADVLRTTRDLGELLGVQQRADSIRQSIEHELQAVRAAVAARPRVSVVYVLSLEPPMVAGPGTFIGELIDIAGGENTFADVQALWPQVSLEEMLRRAPAALVIGRERRTDPIPRMRGLAGWRELNAVRNGRVLAVDVDLFNRPGPTIPRAARALAEFLHPEVTWSH
jgi:iron complex transport system substrate-binding protein